MVRPVRLAPPHRFSREDYHAIAKAGILGEDDRVELIAGEIITQTPIGTAHAGLVNRLNQILIHLARGRGVVSVQNPIALDLFSEPQPDLALLRPKPDFYASSHPEPGDVLLLVEVADTSLAFDREEKIPLYAAAGIPEVWLVDLVGKSISVFRRPAQGTYTEVTRHRSGATISVPGLPDASLAVNDLAM
ncbi:MAG: Uma2 family endonuclease [Verrucomicrobia bacterium]|nr:Uma2 family endonuclease [Verrucomicrobiota bacterium]